MNNEDYIRQFYNLTPDKIKKIDNEYGDFELHHWEYKALIDYIYSLQNQLEEKNNKEEAFRLFLVSRFNNTQDITYLDILMKHKEILLKN